MGRRFTLAVLLGPLAVGAAAALAGPASGSGGSAALAAPGLVVEGTTFVLRLPDGRVLRSPELLGAELTMPDGAVLRIDGVRPDPYDPTILLHQLSAHTDQGWRPFCDADREGHREAFPVPGRWDADGRYHLDPSHFALTCTGGAQAKCVRFGYHPANAADDGAALAPLYEACVHMVRGDYCGDGTPTTRDGTLIDIYDRHGIQQSESGPELTFEAGWAPHGAVCVAHPRIRENITLEQLAAQCPRLAGALGTACDETSAAALGAVLFNRSR
jgi:hypothetical protein